MRKVQQKYNKQCEAKKKRKKNEIQKWLTQFVLGSPVIKLRKSSGPREM